MQGFIVNQIQFFSLHDGPGIRTSVFLQGCNLRCAWCHNPETWSGKPAVSYIKERCHHCGACAQVCPVRAHSIDSRGHIFDYSKCTCCGKCLEVCYSEALEKSGYIIGISELQGMLMRDVRLYEISGGGVTFSGGEPLLQAKALKEICCRLQKSGVHTAVETALGVPWDTVQEASDYLDLFLVDCKVFDSARHERYTGISNKGILENLKRLARIREIAIRLPIIGGINDDVENAKKTADFLKSMGEHILSAELLPYHNFGVEKAARLGICQQEFQEPDEERLEILKQIYRNQGIQIVE